MLFWYEGSINIMNLMNHAFFPKLVAFWVKSFYFVYFQRAPNFLISEKIMESHEHHTYYICKRHTKRNLSLEYALENGSIIFLSYNEVLFLLLSYVVLDYDFEKVILFISNWNLCSFNRCSLIQLKK